MCGIGFIEERLGRIEICVSDERSIISYHECRPYPQAMNLSSAVARYTVLRDCFVFVPEATFVSDEVSV